jgi:hypothetical protein
MTVHLLPWDTSRDLLAEANNLYNQAKTFDCIAGELKPKIKVLS